MPQVIIVLCKKNIGWNIITIPKYGNVPELMNEYFNELIPAKKK